MKTKLFFALTLATYLSTYAWDEELETRTPNPRLTTPSIATQTAHEAWPANNNDPDDISDVRQALGEKELKIAMQLQRAADWDAFTHARCKLAATLNSKKKPRHLLLMSDN